MTRSGFRIRAASTCALLIPIFSAQALAESKKFGLAAALPSDVLLYVGTHHNPERVFIDEYWGGVLDALKESGIADDLMGLISAVLDGEGQAQVERLKERASQLVAAVNWDELCGGEFVFAERLAPPIRAGGGIVMGPPDMVWMFRGTGQGTASNFDALVAILEAMVEEINNAVDAQALSVDRAPKNGAQVASVNLLAAFPGAPEIPLAVARRGDLLLVALGDQLFEEVLGSLAGKGTKPALTDDPRFKAAFEQLPPAEDSMFFFNMQGMLEPMQRLANMALKTVGSPGDVYENARISPEAGELNSAAITAYRVKDFAKALRLTEQAYEIAPHDSIVLYNLACFSALTGKTEAALAWLEKAVDGGFYAPKKIAGDSDLDSLRDLPRYKAALAKALKMAQEAHIKDIVINSTKEGEAYKLGLQAWQAADRGDDEQGLKLVEQAYEVAPKDSRVLYYLACFHARLGHQDRALQFLERAVGGGFCCPGHIAEDSDLEDLRTSKRFKVVLANAREEAARRSSSRSSDKVAAVRGVIDRMMSAAGVLDYSASVESTDQYSVRADTLVALVPDAKDRPIYAVFGGRKPLRGFDRYLPQETLSFAVGSGINAGELYDYIEGTLRVAGPKGEELLAKWTEIQAGLGINLKEDLLSWMDGEYVSVTLEDDRGWVRLIKVTNEEKAREKVAAAIQILSAKISEAAQKNPMLGMAMLTTSPVQSEKLQGFQNVSLAMVPVPVVWGVADSHLIVGSSADAVALCLDTARGEHPNIRNNARVMSEALLPEEPCCSVKLTDRRKLGQELAMACGIASMVGGSMTMTIPDEQARAVILKITGMIAKLAPVMGKIDFYKSTAAYTTFDGNAWRVRQVTHYVSPAEHGSRGAQPAASSP